LLRVGKCQNIARRDGAQLQLEDRESLSDGLLEELTERWRDLIHNLDATVNENFLVIELDYRGIVSFPVLH
jgi:hypothetical protein